MNSTNKQDINQDNQTNVNLSQQNQEDNQQNDIKIHIQILKNQCLKRKQQNYNKLKVWDEERAYILSVHRKSLDKLKQQIELKIKDSIDYIHVIISFFQLQVSQYEEYYNHQFNDPKIAMQNNYIGHNIGISQNQALHKLYDINLQQQNKYKQVAEQITSKLIKVIEYNLNTSQNELVEHRQSIQALILQLQEINADTSQVCSNLANEYYKQKNKETFKSQEDLYSKQEEFMVYAYQQTVVQQKLAQQIINYLQKVERIQIKRGKLLRNILIEYTVIMQKIKHGHSPQILFEQLKKDEQGILLFQYFSCQQLLNGQILDQIKNILRKEQSQYLSYQQFKQYLFSLEFSYFKGSDLILKEFQVSYKIDQERSAQTIIVITIDAYMLLYKAFEKKQNLPNKYDFHFKLDNSISLIQENQITLKIICNLSLGLAVMKYLWKKKGVNEQNFEFTITFATIKQKKEFCECMNKIIP